MAFAVQQEEAARRCQKAKEEANRAILRALFFSPCKGSGGRRGKRERGRGVDAAQLTVRAAQGASLVHFF